MGILPRRLHEKDWVGATLVSLSICLVLGAAPSAQATVYSVDADNPSASDSNSGSENQPWKTLVKATRTARAGDTVMIRAGTYTEGLYVDQQSGRPGARIVFQAHPDDLGLVILNGRCVQILRQSHIEIRDLRIQNCDNVDAHDSRGIAIKGPGVDDIVISGNHTFNTYSSAISAWGVAWKSDPGSFRNITNLIIENNIIEKANNGGYDEQITLANGVEDFIIRYNELKNAGADVNGGEGIDIKEGCAYGKIHHNHIHGIPRRGLYIDGGGRSAFISPTHDIELYGNVVHDVPNGLAIMSEGGGDVYNIKIYNNLIYNTEYDCSFIYDHPDAADKPGKFWNIEYVNNTFWNCLRNSIDVNTRHATNVLIRNNILDGSIVDRTSGDVTKDHNIQGGDPGFVNADSGNYRLDSSSAAVNGGSSTSAPAVDLDGLERGCDGKVDIGAFEYDSGYALHSTVEPAPSNFKCADAQPDSSNVPRAKS